MYNNAALIWVQDFTSGLTLSVLEDLDIFCLLLSALALNLHINLPQNTIEGGKRQDSTEFFNYIKVTI